MSEEERTAGIELRVRYSPTQSPEEVVNQVVSQIVPYLRQVFSTYQMVYRIRLIIQPVFVRTPQPSVTVRTIVKKPVYEEEFERAEEEIGEEEEAE